jgi:hypothetical protein
MNPNRGETRVNQLIAFLPHTSADETAQNVSRSGENVKLKISDFKFQISDYNPAVLWHHFPRQRVGLLS